MDMNYEEVLMTKVSWYYYLEGMTQQKIGELLGISRIRVIKLLERARQTGIIQFKIREDRAGRMETERSLVAKYRLNDAFVIPASVNPEDTNEAVAKAAAIYLSSRLSGNNFINMGYGDTPGRILNHLASLAEHPITCISLTGGVSYYLPNVQSYVFNAKLHLIPLPLLVSSREMADAMKNEPSVREVSRMVELAETSVVGIGAMNEQATIIKSGILGRNDFLYLKMRGAVGDLLSHFIDREGRLVESSIEDRLISTSLSTLRNLKNVVGAAAGMHKVQAIRAVLNGHFLNVLITDEATAAALISDDTGSF